MAADAEGFSASTRERLSKAIPTLRVTTERRRTEGTETARDESIWPIVAKAWPYLNRYISGRWKTWGAAVNPTDVRGGMLFMPVMLTLLTAALWLSAHSVAADPTPTQTLLVFVAKVTAAVTTLFAWGSWAARRVLQVVFSVLTVIGAVLTLVTGALLAPFSGDAKLLAVGVLLFTVLGWLFRVRVTSRGASLSLRTDGHVIYYYILSFISTQTRLITGLVTVDLLYQSILLGRPLSERLVKIFGRPDLGHGVAFMGQEYLLAPARQELLWYNLGVNLVIWLILTIPFSAGLAYYSVWIHQRINQDLRMDLLSRWTQLSPRYHAEHRVGDSIYRIVQDSSGITNIISRLYLGATAITGILQAAFLITFFDPRIAALGLGMAVVMSTFAWWYSPRLKARAIAARESNSDLTSTTQEIVGGVRVTKAYRQEEREQARFEGDSVKAFDGAFRARWLFTITGVVSFILVGLFLLPADFLSAVWANEQRPVLAAGLVALIGLSFTSWNAAAYRWVAGEMDTVAGRIRGINSEWASAQDNTMALRRVFEILETEPDITDKPEAHPIAEFKDEIRFENVSFAYEADRPVLEDVSFVAKPGKIVAIVGPTGSGKSTLMATLLRVFDPDRGRILIDGRDLRDLQVDALREMVSVAPQEPLLFATTVTDNIRYAAPHLGAEQVRLAAEVACADDFIDGLPKGYETTLGDRGAGLSPGQKQRLCIARAIVKDAPIVILDEPTASLDAETEHRVMANLSKWGVGRAIFIITHRLSTVRRADTILFLENGRLSEAGSHAELMAKEGGRYRAMVDAESALAERGAQQTSDAGVPA